MIKTKTIPKINIPRALLNTPEFSFFTLSSPTDIGNMALLMGKVPQKIIFPKIEAIA